MGKKFHHTWSKMKCCSPEVCCSHQYICTAMHDGNETAVPGIAFMGMPTVVLCPKPNGICHNLRVLALETRKTVALPQELWRNLTKSKIEIFIFLLGLGCLVLFVWAIAFFSKLIVDHKDRRPNQPQGRWPSAASESKQQIASSELHTVTPV